LIGILAGLLGWGGQGLYVYLRNPSPAELTCDAYLTQRPDAEWLALAGCQLRLTDAIYEHDLGSASRPNRLFIPVHASDAEPGAKTGLVVETRDPGLLAAYQEVLALDRRQDLSDAEAEAYVLEHAATLFPRRDVQGLIRFGLELEDEDRREIAGLADELTPDFVILEEGARPQPWLSLGAFAAGLVVLGLALRKVLRAVRGPTPALATPDGGGLGEVQSDGPPKPLGPG